MGLGTADDFFRSTPRLMALVVEGKRLAAEAVHRDQITIAWNTAALHRAKKMPPLKELLRKQPRQERKRRTMNADEMLTMARLWSSVAGPEEAEDV